jgi:mono/diheme cytochrome c family protein
MTGMAGTVLSSVGEHTGVSVLHAVLRGVGRCHEGGQVLRAKGCLDCHAVSGRGARLSSDLAQVSGLTSHTGVISALWNRVLISEQPGVENRAWPTMTSAEMADLAAYLGSLGGNP